jgi:energy-coupling factor transporter transmembrane protein EcfT
MHPAIRILCFLILIVFLARAHLLVLPVYLLAFFLLSFKHLVPVIRQAAPLALRLRWFWLSILLLYALMIPGEPVFRFSSSIAISQEGIIIGLERCASLVLVLLFFAFLNFHTRQQDWSAGIYWLARPLHLFGLPVEKITLRISLTMQAVHQLQKQRETKHDSSTQLSGWRQIPDRLVSLFSQVLQRGQQQTLSEHVFELQAVALHQWLYPLVLGISLWFLNHLVRVY